jgi:hypothetical protein
MVLNTQGNLLVYQRYKASVMNIPARGAAIAIWIAAMR